MIKKVSFHQNILMHNIYVDVQLKKTIYANMSTAVRFGMYCLLSSKNLIAKIIALKTCFRVTSNFLIELCNCSTKKTRSWRTRIQPMKSLRNLGQSTKMLTNFFAILKSKTLNFNFDVLKMFV